MKYQDKLRIQDISRIITAAYRLRNISLDSGDQYTLMYICMYVCLGSERK